MAIAAEGLISDILHRLGAQEANIAKQDAEIDNLQKSTDRLEAMLRAMDGKVEGIRSELGERMERGFDRLSQSVDRIDKQTLQAYSPQAAADLASTKAAEGRARAYVIALSAAVVGCLGVIAALITIHP